MAGLRWWSTSIRKRRQASGPIAGRRRAPPSSMRSPPALASALARAAKEGFDLAIVDTPARVEMAAVEACKAADLVLIPTKPSIYDLETLQTTRELVERSGASRPPLVVLNVVPPQASRSEQAAQAIAALGLEVCSAQIGQRVAFEYAGQLGQSAAEYEPDGKAASEIRQVYASICRYLDASTNRGKR